MKSLSFLILLVVLGGCSSVVKKETLDKYLNKSGYFAVAPPLKEIEQIKAYKPCEKSEIVSIKAFGASTFIQYIKFKQNGVVFEFDVQQPENNDVDFLAQNFVDDLKLPATNIKFKEKSMTVKELVCSSSHYTRMPKKYFLTVRGLPDKINRTTGAFGVSEQYIYNKRGDFYGQSIAKDYFYFTDNILTSWQD